MGILDDAIRQHLDLKRQHGADDQEVQQLEDEAFGPPTRPGEPDFPESQEQAAVGAEEAHGSEEATALLDSTEEAHTVAPAAVEPVAPDGAEPGAPEGVDPTAPEAVDAGAFYDQGTDEPEAAEREVAEHHDDEPGESGESAQPISDEHPIETLETVEHPIDGALADEAEVDLPAEEAAVPAEESEPGAGSERIEEEGELSDTEQAEGEDVLEETPEFLRDQPEDDELWFEQGEPKDFDF